MEKLDGKAVLVTGASGTIGRSLCHALTGHGCRLGLLGRSLEKLAVLADQLRQSIPSEGHAKRAPLNGRVVSFRSADLRERPAVHDAVAAVRRELGAVDVLIHNAGVGRMTSATAPNLDDVEEMLQVNYLGGVYAAEAVLPAMLAQGSGHLVAVSSLAALRGMVATAGYSASKAAFATFLESLRPALRRRGIAVSTCYLGFVRTRMSETLPLHPALRMLSPEAAVKHIIRTILRRRREAYFPWYDACGARFLRRLPPRAFDAVMAKLGPLVVKEDG